MRTRVAAILRFDADFIKVIATGAVLTGDRPGRARVHRGRAPRGRRGGGPGTHVAAHAHGAGIKRAIRAGVRSIEHGSLMDDEAIELMASHGTYLVADIYAAIASPGGRARGGPRTYAQEPGDDRGAARGFRRR